MIIYYICVCRKRERKERREKRICLLFSCKNLDQKCTKNLDQKLDQKFRPKKLHFFQGKKRIKHRAVESIIVSIIYVSKNNGRKQKRDADFTETATEEETFMLRGLVFDFGSARVEKSIDS